MTSREITVDVCPRCGHAIDASDNPNGARGCFGGRAGAAHARVERERWVLDLSDGRKVRP